jgi:hypothetical protein
MTKFHSGNPRNDISPQLLREKFTYDPETGLLSKSGRRVGWLHPASGYRYVSVNGRQYKEHRVIWAVHFGVWPVGQIDHKNRRRDDNRLANISDASGSQNQENVGVRKDNTSGFRGVTYHAGAGKFMARVYIDRRRVHLGYFDSAEDAYAACLQAKSTQ